MEKIHVIQNRIINDMPEGVLYIRMDGIIDSVNPAACKLLNLSREKLIGEPFERAFFKYGENDAFNQAILGAVDGGTMLHNRIVRYFDGRVTKNVFITTSFMKHEGKKLGIIVVLNDVSELIELRYAVETMERIKALNEQLEVRNKLICETFGRYLSDEIVKNLLDTPGGLELGGKKCFITILMSDLRGFTAMSESMETDDVLPMLNAYLGTMVDIICKYGGTIIEFIGDSIFAIFGAPAQSDNHATEAVACAIEMQAAMDKVNEYNRGQGYPALEMGIGINTGEAIVGNIGSDKRTKFGVVGRHVNLCGRIENYTVGGQILVSPDTYALLTAKPHVSDTLCVSPKGVRNPITLYSIDGLGEPYNVSCFDETRPIPKRLIVPISFEANVLNGKYIEPDVICGTFEELSRIEAVVYINRELLPMDNLRIRMRDGDNIIFDEVFAKVLKRKENGYLIHFTATNKAFSEFLDEKLSL